MSASPDNKLRILHVLRAPMGGVLRHVRDLALAHTQQGHAVGIICDVAGKPGYNEGMLESLNAQLELGVTRAPMSRSIGPGDIVAAAKIRNLISGLKPDVVHGHGAKGGVFARSCGTLASGNGHRPARIYSSHGGSLHFDPNSKNGKLYFKVERALERLTDCLTFVADYERTTYAAKIGEPTCPAQIIYNGLSDAEFEAVAPDDDAADFLFIGEMRMLKGPDLMLRALARLKAEGADDISAVMVGDGPDRDEIYEMIKDRDLQTNVTMRPPMPARAAFALAKTVVMPSRAEAMPYIVLEALAAGCPLIATNVGGIPEIFGSASDVLIEPEIDALTARMRNALQDLPNLAARMPDHETLKANFSVENMSETMLGVYHTAIEHRING